MQKSISLSLAVCVTLAGCSVVRRSGTWATVTAARIDTRHEADPSKAYATQLSRTLESASVEHKVVTYQFRYRTRLREEAIGTRTAVVYRDDTHPRNPWWIMDEQLKKPVWLPGHDLGKQVAFYLRDDAEVVETQNVPAGGGSKTMIAELPGGTMIALAHREKTTPLREPEVAGIARLAPLRKSDRAQQLIARAPMKKPASPALLIARADEPRAWLRPARFAPVPFVPAFVPVPAGMVPPPVAESFAAMFRSAHHTGFDPASVTDRRKMERLQHAALPRENRARIF